MLPRVDVAQLLRDQSDPAYQAVIARQRAAIMAGKVWRYHEDTGMTLLEPVLDGTPRPLPA